MPHAWREGVVVKLSALVAELQKALACDPDTEVVLEIQDARDFQQHAKTGIAALSTRAEKRGECIITGSVGDGGYFPEVVREHDELDTGYTFDDDDAEEPRGRRPAQHLRARTLQACGDVRHHDAPVDGSRPSTLLWRDIGYALVWGTEEDEEEPLRYQAKTARSGGAQLTRDLESAEPAFVGFIKWDGCMQYRCPDDYNFHVDDRSRLRETAEALERVRDLMRVIAPEVEGR